MSLRLWRERGEENGWVMPAAPAWKRLPVIRLVRATCLLIQIQRHYRFCRSLGMFPSGYDEWVVFGIRFGQERRK